MPSMVLLSRIVYTQYPRYQRGSSERWNFMEKVRMEGIVGLTKLFRNETDGLSKGAVVIFAGSAAVCALFAELLGYAVRDRGFALYFSPLANEKDCRELHWNEGTGYSISPNGKEIVGADLIVILGGLAMPKFGCAVDAVQQFIEKTSKPVTTKVIGLGFMDILRRSGWHLQINFDSILNATMETELESP
jgi:hypothetical protein